MDCFKSIGTVLIMLYTCLILEKICPKPTKFSRKQFQWEFSRFESVMKENFKRRVKIWKQVLKRAFNVAAPFIGMAVEAQTKNLQSTQVTTNLL